MVKMNADIKSWLSYNEILLFQEFVDSTSIRMRQLCETSQYWTRLMSSLTIIIIKCFDNDPSVDVWRSNRGIYVINYYKQLYNFRTTSAVLKLLEYRRV